MVVRSWEAGGFLIFSVPSAARADAKVVKLPRYDAALRRLDRVRYLRKSSILIFAALTIAGCSQRDGTSENGSNQSEGSAMAKRAVAEESRWLANPAKPTQAPLPIPPSALQELLDAPRAADGVVRESLFGKFRLRKDTGFCFLGQVVRAKLPGGIIPVWPLGDVLRHRLESLRPLEDQDEQDRFVSWRSGLCQTISDPIFVRALSLPNHKGAPYRQVLIAWQPSSSAAWYGDVERLADPDNAATWGPMTPETGTPDPSMNRALRQANEDLIAKLIVSLFGREIGRGEL